MKLGLGTVQFGLNYGITNSTGIPTHQEIHSILKVALESKIELLDTAIAYGTSEEQIGAQQPLSAKFKIVTKIPSLKTVNQSTNELIQSSLNKLQVDQLYSVLFHSAEDLYSSKGQECFQTLQTLKDQGLIKKIGISVYDLNHAQDLIDKFPIEIVQLPLNILDQRPLHSGFLSYLKDKGVEIHARSLFLQGLLLDPNAKLNTFFSDLKPHLKKFFDHASQHGRTPLEYCLAFIKSVPEVDYGLIGVLSLSQLKDIIKAFQTPISPLEWTDWEWRGRPELITPSFWPSIK